MNSSGLLWFEEEPKPRSIVMFFFHPEVWTLLTLHIDRCTDACAFVCLARIDGF